MKIPSKGTILGLLGGMAVITLVLAVFLTPAFRELKKMIIGDAIARDAYEMSDYAAEHDLMLPVTWQDLVDWQKKKHPDWSGSVEEFAATFRILQPDLKKGDASTVFVEVIFPEAKPMQDYVNRAVYGAVSRKDPSPDNK